MKRNELILLSVMLSAISLGVETGRISQNWLEKTDTEINSHSKDLFTAIDEYFLQAIVESRYITATSVVWVYGCADKT